jgi:hypothetical protein
MVINVNRASVNGGNHACRDKGDRDHEKVKVFVRVERKVIA